MEKAILTKDLARMVVERGGSKSIANAEAVIKSLLPSIVECLNNGETIKLHGLGTFSVVRIEEREARNPATGEAITVPAHNRPKFKFTPAVKSSVR